MLLSRLSQKAFVLVAGEDVKVINIGHLLGLFYCEWALSRGKKRCSGTYALPVRRVYLSISKLALPRG